MSKVRLAVIGCGSRAQTYCSLAAAMPEKYIIVAGADPVAKRVDKIKIISCNRDFLSFASDKDFLAKPQMADVVIIGTQDDYHYEPCISAMKKGYDIILEKPIADTVEKITEIERVAKENSRSIDVCYVLRYTPFYKKVKEIVESGILGDIVCLSATEGVEPWHQAHSYVRGQWAITEKSTPMLVAKSCHDLDIIHWIIGKKFANVSSFSSQHYFNSKNAPEGAPERCIDGCPHQSECLYNAQRYAGDKRDWLKVLEPNASEMTPQDITDWLKTSQWARCVYRCDNTAVDNQVLSFNFEDNTTGTFTMNAFDYGRRIHLYGTKATLYGWAINKLTGDADILIHHHKDNRTEKVNIDTTDEQGYHHGGGDYGLIKEFYDNYTQNKSNGASSIHSHIIGFAAEYSRKTNQTVNISNFLQNIRKNIYGI